MRHCVSSHSQISIAPYRIQQFESHRANFNPTRQISIPPRNQFIFRGQLNFSLFSYGHHLVVQKFRTSSNFFFQKPGRSAARPRGRPRGRGRAPLSRRRAPSGKHAARPSGERRCRKLNSAWKRFWHTPRAVGRPPPNTRLASGTRG